MTTLTTPNTKGDGQMTIAPYTDQEFLPQLRLDWIESWEQNPRKNLDPATLDELAESIKQHGVQTPITVRYLGSKLAGDGNTTIPRLQIVAGERRVLASIRAHRATIPAIVRVDLTDQNALTLAILENIQRRELNPIETARAYQALLATGYTQEQIAKQIGFAPSTITNTLRLLRLPTQVLDHITKGELTAGHGRALLRFDGFPEYQTSVAALALEEGTSVRTLEESTVPFAHKLRQHVDFLPTQPLTFPLQNINCPECPFHASRVQTYGNNMSVYYCLKPGHHAELRANEKELQAKIDQENLSRERLARENQNAPEEEEEQDEAPVSTANTLPEATPLPNVSSLTNYCLILREDAAPTGCTPQCPCRVTAANWNLQPTQICTNPPRFNQLRQDSQEAQHQAVRDRLLPRIKQIESGCIYGAQAALLVNIYLLAEATYEVALASAKRVGIKLSENDIRTLTSEMYDEDVPERLDILKNSQILGGHLTHWAIQSLVLSEAEHNIKHFGETETPLLDYFTTEVPSVTNL